MMTREMKGKKKKKMTARQKNNNVTFLPLCNQDIVFKSSTKLWMFDLDTRVKHPSFSPTEVTL